MRDLGPEPEPGPLKRYLGILNGALSLLVAINATRLRDRPGVHGGFWLFAYVPSCRLKIVKNARDMRTDGESSGTGSSRNRPAADAVRGCSRA